MIARSQTVLIAGVAIVAAPWADARAGEIVTVTIDAPNLDQWVYPFANDPGGNIYASVFAALASTGFDPQFDNRDGQMLAGFDTGKAGLPAGLGQNAYIVISAVVSATLESDQTFLYDPTPDSYRTWLPQDDPEYLPDDDPGHAVELFLTGFRHGYTAMNYQETTPYSPLGSFGKGIRTAYPLTFLDGQCVDASNNVDERFDPLPFGIGLNAALKPGQPVPADVALTFEIDVADPDVQRMLRRALDGGIVDFTVASIFPAEQQQTGTYPRFYTKEHLAVIVGLVSAATLDLTVEILDSPPPASDVDLSGEVNLDDLLAVIGLWGPCACCAADVNGDDVVNVDDLLAVIASWGT
jgi:hypothetical protein